MDISTISIALLAMGGLGLIFSIGLAIANKIFHVEEDPRISRISELLPGANCGACGIPRMHEFCRKCGEWER